MGLAESIVSLGDPVKSVSHEVTFEQDVSDAERLSATIGALSEKVASRLRRQGLAARTIVLKYRYAGFETHTASRSLGDATADDRRIAATAMELLESKRDRSRPLRLVGVAGTNLEMDGGQLDLLADGEAGERRERMLAAVDSIRSRHGFGAIQRASSRDPSRGAWG